MGTWGMMSFSITPWNTGRGGRSIARNRKGDFVVLISARGPNGSQALADPDLAANPPRHNPNSRILTSTQVKPWNSSILSRGDNLLVIHPDLPLEGAVNDARARLAVPAQVLVKRVEQPTEELERVAHLSDLEPAPTPIRAFLQ